MARAFPVLMFHTLEEQAPAISFSPGAFRRGMAVLRERGYRTARLLTAVEDARSGGPFPDRMLVITFDDGYQSVYDEAFPVLQEFGMTATVFLTVGAPDAVQSTERPPPLKGRTMMSWRQVREMQRAGISFGAHTCTHPDLTRLPAERAQAEIRDSKAILEAALGVAVDCFAYPFGRFDRHTRAIAQQHFACACSDRLGLVTARSDPYALERLDAYYFRQRRTFDLVTTKLLSPYVWARSIPRQLRRAVYWRPASGPHGEPG